MKSGYTGLWLLLALSLGIFLAVSFSESDITLLGHTFKKAPFRRTLLAQQDTAAGADMDSLIRAQSEEPQKLNPMDSTAQSIFIFGDSMTFNLALRLAQYAKHNGHIIHSVNWDSSNTRIWAESDTLEYFLHKFNPTYVFISLGSNEMYFKNPRTRLPYVKKILEKIGDLPYVWIGPPNWEEDTGINQMLLENTRPGSFFLSQGMDFKRKKDKIHPTRQSSALWVDSIMRWMPKSGHPILADTPPDSIGRVNPGIVFLKALNK